jgi:putative NADH-flavin reductase
MKIALVGIAGKIGSQIALEAKKRGHVITGISRRAAPATGELAALCIVTADIFDQHALATAAKDHDIPASAFGPSPDAIATVPEAARALAAAARTAGIKRVIVVGGAGSLQVSSGLQLVDTPGFPDMDKPYALAHREALAVLREAKDLDRTFFAPAAEIGPGEKKGRFRVDARNLIADASGHSRISYGDYADAFVSEIAAGRNLNEIATAAH